MWKSPLTPAGVCRLVDLILVWFCPVMKSPLTSAGVCRQVDLIMVLFLFCSVLKSPLTPAGGFDLVCSSRYWL